MPTWRRRDPKRIAAAWSVDRNGSAFTDVFHVTAHPSGRIPPFTDEIHYWRRVGVNGSWDGSGIPSDDWSAVRVVPLPGAVWLLGSALLGLALKRRQ